MTTIDMFSAAAVAGSSVPPSIPSPVRVERVPDRVSVPKPKRARASSRSPEQVAASVQRGKVTRAINSAIHGCSVLLEDDKQAAIDWAAKRDHPAPPSPFVAVVSVGSFRKSDTDGRLHHLKCHFGR